MADDETDLKKRLGEKARHIKWTHQIRAGFMNPADRPDYYTQVANEAEQREQAEKRAKKKSSGI